MEAARVSKEDQRQYAKAMRDRPYRPHVEGLPFAVVADMDGTLVLVGDRNPYAADECAVDKPNLPVIGVFLTQEHMGDHLIVVSAREEKYRPQTLAQLAEHVGEVGGEGPVAQLYMRATGDNRPDAEVKREIYEKILAEYNVRFVLDDRTRVVEMLRDMGLPVFQVAFGDF